MMAEVLACAQVCTRPEKNMSAAYAYACRSHEPGTPVAWLDDAGMAAVYIMIDNCAPAAWSDTRRPRAACQPTGGGQCQPRCTAAWANTCL